MIAKLVPALVALVTLVVVAATPARADQKADRAAIADASTKLSASATTLANTAKASEDRGARKKFAPAAAELADDLAALAKRAGKEVAAKLLVTDATAIEKDATALVELADEADDKAERKALRAQAQLLQQGVVAVRKSAEMLKDDAKTKDGPAAPQRFSGRLLNNSDSCSWAENLKFVISRDGQQVFASLNMVFPGKDEPVVLDKGRYAVQLLDTSGKLLGQRALEVAKEGWSFKSGCVNQD